ncbi:uncharacterized protein ACNS7B_000274 [Menidia menidia]
MDQSEEPKGSLCGKHESQSRAQRKQPQPEPDPSCVSFKSDWSMHRPIEFKPDVPSDKQTHQRLRPGPEPVPEPGHGPGPGHSCVSMKSDGSMGKPINFKPAHPPSFQRVEQQSSEVPGAQSAQQHQTQLDSIFMLLENNMITFVKEELMKIQKALSPDDPQCLESQREDEDAEQWSSREALVKITVHFLRRMKQEELAEHLRSKHCAAVCGRKHKSALKKKFQCVFEGISKAGNPTLLNQIYTELYITEGGAAGLNEEHEVRQIEAASRKADRPETTIRQEDVLKVPPGKEQPIRVVLTKGVAGIGKTVLTQKFTLDWAEGKANQDIHFLFPFTFRELNVLRGKQFSLLGLLHHFFPETRAAGVCSSAEFQVVFIFDGLDESRLPLDFHNQKPLTDVTESSSVDVLLTSLIRGKLLPSARLWITTRPAAANQIPADCISMVTEVRGFTEEQKEQYFRKRFREKSQASSIISHIRSCRSLHIMCHIPVFCWISATVLEKMLRTREGGQLPKSLTEMYIHFLVVQAKVKRVKYDGGAETDPHWSPESKKMVESLGKLAFDQLQKGNLIFYESDLTECGIDISAASVYSGVFTQIFKEESGLYQDRVFCFIHLSVQEFLAALHLHLTFTSSGINMLEEQKRTFKSLAKKPKLKHLHQSAVNVALQSPNGHLDLFLRFLLGLSLKTNQRLLRGLLTQTGFNSHTNQETVQYIKEKLSEDESAERSINLFHCLNELNDDSLVEQIQQALSSGSLSIHRLSPAQWSALVFVLLSSEKDLDEFDLKKYSASEEALLRLLPVVKASKKALLRGCNLSERSCEALSSVLSSQSSSLTHLDLSNNQLEDSGVKHVSAGLESTNCRLETLRLSGCNLSTRSCKALSSVFSSQSSSLTHLDLSNNQLEDSGVKHVSAGLESTNCRLETLSLSSCGISEEGCSSLASAVTSNPSHLKELDLSYNRPGDSGVKLLMAALKDPHKLRLTDCGLSESVCEAVASALKSSPSHLKELDLSRNMLMDSGGKHLFAGLESPNCRLETLRLEGCRLSESSWSSVVSALKSNPSHLTELDLSWNPISEYVMKELSSFLQSPLCGLKTLRLQCCGLSNISGSSLVSALKSKSSRLTELDLRYNHNLQESVTKQLSELVESPDYKLKTLRLERFCVSEISCAPLASALESNPSELRKLDLSYNNLKDSEVKQLCGLLGSDLCRLEIVRLQCCGLSNISGASVVSALKSNPSHLTELDLSLNPISECVMKELSSFLQSPLCGLKTLRLELCSLSESCWYSVVSALKSNPSHLKELDLSLNSISECVMKELSSFLQSPLCGLKTLRLQCCGLSNISGVSLVSALKSKSSRLTELDLRYNHNLQESVTKQLSELVESLDYQLKTLRLERCCVSEISCAPLASALESNPSELRKLDLSGSKLEDSEVKQLCGLLGSDLCRLESLRLQCCGLSNISGASVVSALKSNPSHLTELDLSLDPISECVMKELSSFLQSPLCGLKTLRLELCSLSETSWSSVVSALRSNPSHLTELDLSWNPISECVMKELSSFLQSPLCGLKTLRLRGCNLSERSCKALSSVLSSQSSSLTHLDLSNNQLRDSGGKNVSPGLESPNCRLETLRLADCGLSESVCEAVASALKSSPSHLKELDLSRNMLRDSGVKHVSAGLESPNCRLETLSLSSCGISGKGCSSLASAVTSNPSHLKELDLSSNRPGDSGVKMLMAALKDPHKLRLADCGLSESVCEAVASALKSSPSHLKELDLSRNMLMDSGGKHLSAGLESPKCRLETLRLEGCRLSDTSWSSVVSALKSNPSHLTELDLSWNPISECVMKELSSFLQSPLCGLKTLRLQCCGLSNISGASLVSALKSKSSRLTELDLTYNHNLQESVTKQLFELVESPGYKLKTLRLERCCVSEISCAPLASALESSPSDLRKLDLSGNKLENSEVKQLCGLLGSDLCRLESLRLEGCRLSESSWSSLVSALKSNPSHLTELDLSWNLLSECVMKELSSFLQSPLCGLKTLRLENCSLSESSWSSVVSALKSNPFHLTELDLSRNPIYECVMKELSSFLQSPLCGLKTLKLWNCSLSETSCARLASALKSNPSHLTELDLSSNYLERSAVQQLLDLQQSPHNKLQTVRWE